MCECSYKDSPLRYGFRIVKFDLLHETTSRDERALWVSIADDEQMREFCETEWNRDNLRALSLTGIGAMRWFKRFEYLQALDLCGFSIDPGSCLDFTDFEYMYVLSLRNMGLTDLVQQVKLPKGIYVLKLSGNLLTDVVWPPLLYNLCLLGNLLTEFPMSAVRVCNRHLCVRGNPIREFNIRWRHVGLSHAAPVICPLDERGIKTVAMFERMEGSNVKGVVARRETAWILREAAYVGGAAISELPSDLCRVLMLKYLRW
jgi:hypothetical protein